MKKSRQVVYIDPNNSNLKKVNISFLKIFFGFIIVTLFIVVSLKVSADLMIKFNYNSKLSQLSKENQLLEKQIKMMGDKITLLRDQVDQIEALDDELRTMLDFSPIDSDVRQVGIGGSDVIELANLEIQDPDLNASVKDNHSVLARLEREIKLEMESFKKLLSNMERKEDSLKYLPAIKPVPNGRLTDRFGNRKHPILKRYKFHEGIDFGADRGTPILAAADGYVTFTGKNGGYGLFVSINHKYGFETKYGHLQKIYVRRGQYVKRGDKIGEVGNTGLSTAPHLHYEVHYRGKAVNPINYYFPDIAFN